MNCRRDANVDENCAHNLCKPLTNYGRMGQPVKGLIHFGCIQCKCSIKTHSPIKLNREVKHDVVTPFEISTAGGMGRQTTMTSNMCNAPLVQRLG